MADHARALPLRDRHRIVAAAAVDHDAFLGEDDAVETGADIGGLVLGDDDDAQPRHAISIASCAPGPPGFPNNPSLACAGRAVAHRAPVLEGLAQPA